MSERDLSRWSLRQLLANELQSAAYDAHMDIVLKMTRPSTPQRTEGIRRGNAVLDRDRLKDADRLLEIMRSRFGATIDGDVIDRNEPVRKFAREVLGEDT